MVRVSGKASFILTNYSIHQHALAMEVIQIICLVGAETIINLSNNSLHVLLLSLRERVHERPG